MSEIDDIFNEMELHSVNNSYGVSTMIINVGMVLVILVSIGVWLKMNKYEVKNA